MADFGQIGEAFVDIRANFGTFQKDLSGSQRKLGRSLQTIGQGFTNVGSKLTVGLTLPLIAAAATAVKFGSDFESGFAGVRKTVEATEKQFGELRTGFRELAKQTGTSAVEILGIGEAAGQLGIETKNILGFTRVMADLGVTTNLSAQEAATALARLANITQLPQDQFDRLGSTIVDLGNNLATTEREIVEFGLRIAGAGKQVGLSEAEILAFGAALSSVGVRAEAGGTAISKTFIKIASAIADGGEVLDEFARVAGLSVEDFKVAFETDAAGATVTFIEGLKKLSDEGQNVFGVLEDLGLQDQRLRDALLRAAGAGDLLRKSLEIGSRAFEENTALAKEAEQRYATFESQIAMLGEEFKDIAVTIFTSLRPVIVEQIIPLTRSVLGFVAGLAEGFAKLPKPVKTAAIALVALLAALGPIIVVVGTLVSSLGTIVLTFGGIAGATGLAGAGVIGFSGIMAGLVPILLAVGSAAVVVGVAFAPLTVGIKLQDAVVQFLLIDQQMERVAETANTTVLDSFNRLRETVRDIKFPPELGEELDRLFAQFQDTGDVELFRLGLENVGLEMIQVAGEAQAVQEEIDKLAETEKKAEEETKKLAEAQKEASETAEKLAESAKKLAEEQKRAAEATFNTLQPFRSLNEQFKLAEAGGATATQFVLAFREELKTAGEEAGTTAALMEALGISIDELSPDLQSAIKSLEETEKKIQGLALAGLEFMDLPLAQSVEDFKEQLENLQTPNTAAIRNAEALNNAWKDLRRRTTEASIEILSLEIEIKAYLKAGATAEQVTDKFGSRISKAEKQSELFGKTLGQNTKEMIKFGKQAKETADFADNFQKQWNTAMGNVLGSFIESITEMDFSFRRFGRSLVDTIKSLARTVIGTFIGSLFKPILKLGQRFAENLSGTILSGLTGGEAPAGGLLGGLDFGGTFKGIGASISGAFKSAIPFLTNPITLAVAGIGLAIFGAFKLFTKTPLEAGIKEVTRDFGVSVSEDTLEGFTKGLGLSEEQFKPIRKEILYSPEAFKNVLLPAAQATGQVDQLVAKFGQLAAFGKVYELSGAAAKAAAGDFSDFNKQFMDIFKDSNALTAQFGDDLKGLLVGTPEEKAEAVGEAVETAQTGELLGDIFVDRLDALIELFGEGLETLSDKLSEIVDRLTALIEGPVEIEGLEVEPMGGTFNIFIEAINAESFRDFMAGDGGDVFINEILLRRQQQMVEIVQTGSKGTEE